MNLKNNIKGQGLPLNTIVIAILVIIVLLVIVVSFTSNFSDSNDSLNEVSGCTMSNSVLGVSYTEAQTVNADAANFDGDASCAQNAGNGFTFVSILGKDEVKNSDGNVESYNICCGLKK